MTDEVTPTPIPAASATGSANARAASTLPIGETNSEGEQHGGSEAVDASRLRPAREAMRQDDVDGEQRRVGEGERNADGLPGELDVRQQVDAGDRGADAREVAGRAQADESERDRADEFDRRHRRKRQAGRSRRRRHTFMSAKTRPREATSSHAAPVELRQRSPRPSPEREDQPPPTRCEATQPRARRPVRRAERRTTGRGSGRPRCRRNRRAGAAARRRCGAAAGR